MNCSLDVDIWRMDIWRQESLQRIARCSSAPL